MSAPPIADLASFSTPLPPPLALRVLPAVERRIREGHPWVFERSITSQSREEAPPGTPAVLFDRKGRFLAVGLYDPEGVIRVRVLQAGSPAHIGADLFRHRLLEALDRRRGVASAETTGLRLVHGENDRLPGLILDRYGSSLVLKLYSRSWLPHLPTLVPLLEELLTPEAILLLGSRALQGGGATFPTIGRGAVLFGPPPAPGAGIPFLESGLHFEAHPFEGHKTGFYLDQRENRRRLAGLTEGTRVLNVFSYTGGFSLYAARGGAREVTSVDLSAPALQQAERHFELNRGDPAVAQARHRTIQGDAFRVLEELGRAREVFEVVVVDPPSFTREEGQVPRALSAYRRLTRLALPLLRPGGLLVQASCSSRVGTEAFHEGVLEASREGGRPLRELARTGHPPDHPIGFPEGEYLRCLWARVPG